MRGRPGFLDAFWSKVVILGPNDCWLWTGARLLNGYGHIGLR